MKTVVSNCKSVEEASKLLAQHSRPCGDNISVDALSKTTETTWKIICFNCDKVGHISRKWKEKKVMCSKCAKVGHLERFYRKKYQKNV